MSTENVEVTFVSAGATARVRAGKTLLEAARDASVNLPAPCDGKGTCGKCKVTVLEGEVSEPTEAEHRLLSQTERDLQVRLACQTQALGDVRVQVISEAEVVVRKELSLQTVREFELAPNVRRITPALQQPEIEDQRSDFLRIRQAAGIEYNELTASLTFLKKLPFVVRESDYEIAMTLIGNRATEVETSALAPDPLGVAVDIGTTTCVAYIVNLSTGELAATGSTLNPQSAHGADIISRIEHIKETDEGLRELQGEIINAINAMVQQAVEDIGATTDQIYEMTVVGNTAMHHIFLGLDPRYIA
ncbi:MAG: 2Fe-2S iron-sulfur cluster-binding protein, partial [Armatimonadota bacterium]